MNTGFSGRIGLMQRVLPTYRVPFFEALGQACPDGLSLFAGQPRPSENIPQAHGLSGVHFVLADNLHFLKGPLYFCWQRGLLAWLNTWQPALLITEANPRYLSTPKAIRWMHTRGRPVIGWGLGAPTHQGAFAWLSNFSRQSFVQQFDAVITYSQKGAEQYQALGFDPQSIFVAVNAVTSRPNHPLPQRSAQFSGKARVLFVGRLQARKRLDNLLRACATLPPNLQPELWIIGDGPARAELECLADHVFPAAQFLGAKYNQELTGYFTKADLFVLPGTGGLAVQQAMSFGLPVIVAEADGTQDDLVQPDNGWQIPADDLPALTKAMRRALADSRQLRRMGAASFRIVSEEVNLETMVNVFLQAMQHASTRVKRASA